MTSSNDLREKIKILFTAQKLAVLATQCDNQPYTSLVAFVSNESLTKILFATERDTRKFQHLKANPQVSILIHSGANDEVDFKKAMAVTVVGVAAEAEEATKNDYQKQFLLKNPSLADFINSPSVAIVEVKIASCYLVEKFQQLAEFKP